MLEQAPQDLRKLGYIFIYARIELLAKGVGAPFRLGHIIQAVQFLLQGVQALLSLLQVLLVDVHAVHVLQCLNQVLDSFLQVIDLIHDVGAVDFLHLLA